MKRSSVTAFSLALSAMLAMPIGMASCHAADTMPIGLDSLANDDKVMTELANRGITTLLNREFAVKNVPPEQQQAIRSLGALRQLTDPAVTDQQQKQQLIDNIVGNIPMLLPMLSSNPQLLMTQARIIFTVAGEPLVSTMENLPNDQAKARLLPIASAVVMMEDAAYKAEDGIRTKLADKIPDANDSRYEAAAKQWQDADNLCNAALYMKCRFQYAQVLAMEAADPKRAVIIKEALDNLAGWDNAESTLQAAVRIQMAQLNIAKGDGRSLDDARKLLATIIDPKTDVAPAPTDEDKFNARFFLVLPELVEGDAAAAQKALDDVAGFQKSHLATDTAAALSVQLLNYRLLAMKAASATGDAKTAANKAAVDSLTQTLQDFPQYKGLILQQLAALLPDSPDMAKLPPLLLDSLQMQAWAAIKDKKPTDQFDKSKLQRGLAAAQEVMRRSATEKIDPHIVQSSSLIIGQFLRYQGKLLESATAFLDHAEKFAKAGPDAHAAAALDLAADVIDHLPNPSSEDAVALQDRFLMLAINAPFNHKEYVLQLAGRLFRKSQWKEAVRYYHLVDESAQPADQLTSRFFELLADKSELDEDAKLAAAERSQLVGDIQALAPKVNVLADGVISNSKSKEDEKKRAKSNKAETALIAADIVRREQKNPKAVLALLTGYEDTVRGLANEKPLLSRALFLRVDSYMALKQNKNATDALVQFLQTAGLDEGAPTVQALIKSLTNDLAHAEANADAARKENDTAALNAALASMHETADSRSTLCEFLVKWAADKAANETKEPMKAKIQLYWFSRFQADAKRLSATLETDPAQRQKALNDALAMYKSLQSDQSVAIYKEMVNVQNKTSEHKTNPNYPDPFVTVGFGMIAFELQQYEQARDTLWPLIKDGKLGENNDLSWEATYDYLCATHQLAKKNNSPADDDNVKASLKGLYAVWQDNTGGLQFKQKYADLCQEVLPGWKPTTQPSTQPAH